MGVKQTVQGHGPFHGGHRGGSLQDFREVIEQAPHVSRGEFLMGGFPPLAHNLRDRFAAHNAGQQGAESSGRALPGRSTPGPCRPRIGQAA